MTQTEKILDKKKKKTKKKEKLSYVEVLFCDVLCYNLYANLDKECVALWPLPFTFKSILRRQKGRRIMKTQIYFTMQKYHLPKK